MTEPANPTPPSDPQQPSAQPPPIPPSPAGGHAPPPLGYHSGFAGEMDKDARNWCMAVHLSALIGLTTIPPIVGPLIVWLIKRNEIPAVDDQGKEALNFHLTMLIIGVLLTPTICLGVGIVLLIGLGIAVLVLSVVAAIQASSGVLYRYPFTWRMIK